MDLTPAPVRGAFDINHWPAARKVLRSHLNKPLFDSFVPGTKG